MIITNLAGMSRLAMLLSHEEHESAAVETTKWGALAETELSRGEIAFLWLIMLGVLYVVFSYYAGDVLGLGYELIERNRVG